MDHGIEPCKENSGHARGNSSCMEMVGYKRLGSQGIQYPKCKPGRNWELGQSHMRESDESHVESSMMSYSGSELVCRGNSSSELKSMCSVKRQGGNGGKQSHVCRYCRRIFSSGRALGGHMRVHGVNGPKRGQASLLRMHSSFSLDQMGDYYSSTMKKSEVPSSRSSDNTNTDHVEDEEEEEDSKGLDEHNMNIDEHNMSLDGGQDLSNGFAHRMAALYTRRRNPKRSSRLVDQENSMEMTANCWFNSSRVCHQCGKEFSSSKALFGHMRCHPEREWRGIQPPIADTNTDPVTINDIMTAVDASNNNGAIVVAASSDLFWQSSPESEDLVYPEVKREEDQASENESDAESMKAGKAAAHQQKPTSSFLNWSVTAKRGRRRTARTTQTQAEDGNDAGEEEEEAEVNTNKRELEGDRDTAYFLFMLASSTSNNNNNDITTNNKASEKGDEHVERQVTEESVYDSKTQQSGKRASEGSNVKLEVEGKEDMNWKGKSIKETKKRKTDKTSRPAEAGESGSFLGRKQELIAGKYKCCTCKKLFSSHQALGGHRASHKKVKGCYAMTAVNDEGQDVTEEEITEDGTLLRIEYPVAADDRHSLPAREEARASLSHLIQEVSPELVTVSKKVKGHECSICHKIFPSGQALGGHKRCHWTGDRVTETASSVISTEKQPKAPARNVRELPFDLNELPPVEEVDLDVVPACAESVDKRVKMLGPVINTGFTHVRCNICGCLFTSMDCLRKHQIEHALMPAS